MKVFRFLSLLALTSMCMLACGKANPDNGGGEEPEVDYSDIKPDKPGKWLEMPALGEQNLFFFTHDMTRDGKKMRNYSFYYDPEAKLSSWVAYPLNPGLRGSGNRTDTWTLNPKLPLKYQAVLSSSYKDLSGKSGVYFRGHQIPSADRYGPGINEQTFYFTNSTPQIADLNEEAWQELEFYVRNWSEKVDTLYVVTGADYKKSTTKALDANRKTVRVPSGYYKALVAYKAEAQEAWGGSNYAGIAFYFEHKFYSDDAIMSSQAMSIDALESKMGLDFFVNLPEVAGKSVADAVESSTYMKWWNPDKK